MSFWVGSLATGFVLGTPLAYAALGELVAEKAGVINLGVEGMLLMGAVSGFVVAVQTQSPVAGFLAAAATGTLLSLVHAVLVIGLRVNQIVSGLTLAILGAGLSAYIGTGYAGRRPPSGLPNLPIPGLSGIPALGPILFDHDVLVYGVPVLALGIWLFLSRTRAGLALRAVGEQPAAADTAGIPVFPYRYAAVLVGGALAGLAGAYFSIVYTRGWAENLTGGRGWIALALVIFAAWDARLVLLGAFLFGFVDSLNFQLQNVGVPISTHVLAMMPYVFTLVVLAATWTRLRRTRFGMPGALGTPYEREAR